MLVASKTGFSLLEVLVALVILTVGVFAAARSLAVMSHTLGSATILTGAALLGSSQMEILLAQGCEAANSTGEASNRGVSARWFVQSMPGSVRLGVVLAYPLDYVNRVDSIVHILSCPNEA